jgi:predicted TPR repeat methyltransferase
MLSVLLMEQQKQQQQQQQQQKSVLLSHSTDRRSHRHQGRRENTQQRQSSLSLPQSSSNDTKNNDDYNDNENDNNKDDEAIKWAQKAILIAPKKPYGYMALSQVSTNYQERIEALQVCTKLLLTQQLLVLLVVSDDGDEEYNNNNNNNNNNTNNDCNRGGTVSWSAPERIHWTVTRLSLLVRLLVEPRDEETKQVRGKVGSGSSNHPSRRPLNDDELIVYDDIVKTLSAMWTITTTKKKETKNYVNYINNNNTNSSSSSSSSSSSTPTNHHDKANDNNSSTIDNNNNNDNNSDHIVSVCNDDDDGDDDEGIRVTWKQIAVLSHQEFRLGRFFRKKLPSDINPSRSRSHFRNSIEGYQMLLVMPSGGGSNNINNNIDSSTSTTIADRKVREIQCQNDAPNSKKAIGEVKKNCAMARFWLATLQQGNNMSHHHSDNDDDHSDDNDRLSSTVVGSLTGGAGSDGVLSKCPPEYVVGLYATFAERFDELLVEKLQYQTPTKLRRLLDSVLLPVTGTSTSCCIHHRRRGRRGLLFERAIDLGCGTGLSGVAFADLIVKQRSCGGGEGGATFIGIDLSPEMATKARERNCYDSVIVADVTQAFSILSTTNSTIDGDDHIDKFERNKSVFYDLVIACDVFCYLGDLSIVFEAVSKSLRQRSTTAGSHYCYDDGYFCFSTECLNGTKNSPTIDNREYCLHECARFQHSDKYIRRLAAEYDMDVIRLEKDTIRKNQGTDVTGWLVILQKRSDGTT